MNPSLPIMIRPASEISGYRTAWTSPSLPGSSLNAGGSGTALPEPIRRPFVQGPTKLNTPTTDEGVKRSLLKGHFIDTLNRRLSKAMPAVGLAALITYAGYLAEPSENHFSERSPFVAWLDESSEGTWDSSVSQNVFGSSTTPGNEVKTHATQTDEFLPSSKYAGAAPDAMFSLLTEVATRLVNESKQLDRDFAMVVQKEFWNLLQ